MSNPSTIWDLLRAGSDNDIAIDGLGRPPLRYADLRAQVDTTIETLNQLGIGNNDRLAIVLPNGPDMAVAFVSIACGVTTAGDTFCRGRGSEGQLGDGTFSFQNPTPQFAIDLDPTIP